MTPTLAEAVLMCVFRHRICVISLLRVISVVNWDMDDITYYASDVALYSVLEPTLGVINICLPTIRPAILAIAGKNPRKGHSVREQSSGKDASWNTRSKDSGAASRRNRLRGNDLELTDLDRADDQFPLTTLVEGGRGPSDADITGQNPREITVERRWEVQGHDSSLTPGTRQ